MAKKTAKEVNLVSKDNTSFKDDKFVYLQDELDAIRGAMRMYIPRGETDGALHLFKEIFNNALDECNNENSPANKIIVEFRESECKFSVSDEGRGIPTDILIDAVMKKHVSTKLVDLSETRNKRQTGIHGVGMTVTAALTDYMSLTTYREDHCKTIELIDGVMKEYPIKKLKKPRHGLEVTLIPSEKYLGEINLTNDIVEDFIRHMAYIVPDGIIIEFYKEGPDGKMVFTKYHNLGLSENLHYLSSSLEFPPIELKIITENFDLFAAFAYDKTTDDIIYESYANYVITTEGGTHEQLVIRSLCEYFTREAKKADATSKYEVSYDDCKKGLCFVVNIEHVRPELEGQHKSKISNKDILADGKKPLLDALHNYFSNNPTQLKKIITYLRQISKIRQEAHKIKGVSNKKPSTFLDDAEIKMFKNVSDRKYNGYKELYIAEGDSALSGIDSARNPKYQAIFGVQGVIDNTHDLTLTQLLQKRTFKNLVKILGCGIGKDFDITKLRFNKIIIACDSDVDGSNITSLILCFFYIFMPELITQNKVFRAMPPLYLLDKKSLKKFYNGREWLYDKQEYYDLLNTIIANNATIALPKKSSKKNEVNILSKKEKKEWLSLNAEYNLELLNLSKKATCDETILEYVCWYLLESDGNVGLFKKLIEKEFNEMEFDPSNQVLLGSWNGNYFSLICDKLFLKSAKRFMNLLSQNISLFVYCGDKNGDDMEKMTIGQFFNLMHRNYNVKIEQRFKGIGESDADLLFVTTTNPKLRTLIKFDLNSIEATNNMFELLHGKSENMREQRRQLLENAEISYADIDN